MNVELYNACVDVQLCYVTRYKSCAWFAHVVQDVACSSPRQNSGS